MSKWEMVKLKELCETTQGVQVPLNKQIDYNKPNYIRYLYISDFKVNNKQLFVEDIFPSKVVTETDLVMANTGSPGAVFKGKYGVLSNNLFKISFDNKVLFNDYLYMYLASSVFQNILQSKMKGGIQKHLGHKTIGEQMILLPPLETQKQIAKTLDTAAELLAMRKLQLAELDNLIKSTFYDMFGDPVANEKGWEIKKLGEISTIKSGGTPSRSHPEYFEGEIPWITTVALGKTFIDENDAVEFINEEAIEHSATNLIKENSLLFGIRVGVGKISINKVAMCTNQDIVAIVDVKSDLHNQVYLVKTIKTYADYFNKQKRGATIQGIKNETLKSIDIPIPPFSLQTQFAEIVNKIEEQKLLVKKAIDETQYLFDCLMSEYFD